MFTFPILCIVIAVIMLALATACIYFLVKVQPRLKAEQRAAALANTLTRGRHARSPRLVPAHRA